jgi:hypothetical protein
MESSTAPEVAPGSVAAHVQRYPAAPRSEPPPLRAPVQRRDATFWNNDPALATALLGTPLPVQAKGDARDDEAAVQRAASAGVSGSGGPLPHLDAIQQSFGAHDVSGVKAHVGDRAAAASRAIGAEAYATGNDVAFRHAPDLHTAAHEAAHVVQQRQGVQLKGGVGRAGDQYECHADAVADLVVRGESAEALLGSKAGPSRSAPAVQRWTAKEHRDLGNEGSGKRMVELAPGYEIPFGEVNALADHFANMAQMRTFAKKAKGPESREEIEYARMWKGFIPKRNGIWKNEDIKKAQEGRYFTLAGGNVSHFLNSRAGDAKKHPGKRAGDAVSYLSASRTTAPPGGSQGYRMNHVWAICEAVKAGKSGKSIGRAMALEAFGSHFLTDAFSAGHVRTERAGIKQYWDAKLPMFPYNMLHFIATRVAENLGTFQENPLVTGTPVIGGGTKVLSKRKGTLGKVARKARKSFPTDATMRRELGVLKEVRKLLADKKFTFGDVVSLALHDSDNEHGIQATIKGQDVFLLGDGKLDAKTIRIFGMPIPNTGNEQGRAFAVEAVKAGVADIERAYKLGQQGKNDKQAIAALMKKNLFAPEAYLPKAKPDKDQSKESKTVFWKTASAADLLADEDFGTAVSSFMTGQYTTLAKVASSLPKEQQTAFEKGVLADLREPNKHIPLLRKIVDYVPNDSGNVRWEAEGAAAYYNKAKRTGKDGAGAKSLTYQQRYKLMAKLIHHPYSTHELWGVLDTAPEWQARALIMAFGWDMLNKKIGEDGKFSKFSNRFPRKSFPVTKLKKGR